MAKNFIKPRKHETGRTITTKTAYGITSDMLVTDSHIVSKIPIGVDSILVKDDIGYFIVDKNRLDDGLACPQRYDASFREKSNNFIMEKMNEQSDPDSAAKNF